MLIVKLVFPDQYQAGLMFTQNMTSSTTLYNVCAVPCGVFSTVGDIMSTMGDS